MHKTIAADDPRLDLTAARSSDKDALFLLFRALFETCGRDQQRTVQALHDETFIQTPPALEDHFERLASNGWVVESAQRPGWFRLTERGVAEYCSDGHA